VSKKRSAWNWEVGNESRASIKVKKVVERWLCTLEELRAEQSYGYLIGTPICGGPLVRILPMGKTARSFKEDHLVLWKLIATARNRCERRCRRKCRALYQSLSRCAGNSFSSARQRERADQVARISWVGEKEWRVCAHAERAGYRRQGLAHITRAKWRNKEVCWGEAADCCVERGGLQWIVADPLTVKLLAQFRRRLDFGSLRSERGERWGETHKRRLCWCGDNEDPHGGDDGILLKRTDHLSDQLKHEVTQWRSGPGSISSSH